MKNLHYIIIIVVSFIILLSAQSYKNNPIKLSENIGFEIDENERKQYNLFPDLKEFKSAQIFVVSDSKYILEYKIKTQYGIKSKTVKISQEVFETTIKHISITEKHFQKSDSTDEKPCDEAEVIFNLGLKYASKAKYKLTSQLFNTIVSDYPQSSAVFKVNKLLPDIKQLKKTKKGLFLKGGMLDQSGRPEFLVFSGYYGLWLGIATPIAFKSESSQVYALGLLTGGPASFYLSYSMTKNSNISNGRATMIMLGGHWGTWQGLGWGAVGDWDGNEIVGFSEFLGIGGIVAGSVISNQYDFSEGHASITNSAMPWGAWFGLMFAGIVEHKDDTVLKDMLIGSNVFMVGAGIAARNSTMEVGRVRMINLGGILGATFGFGINLLLEVDDGQLAFTIVSATTAGGLLMGTKLTNNYGNKKNNLNNSSSNEVSFLNKNKWKLSSDIKLHQKAFTENTLIPFMQLKLSF